MRILIDTNILIWALNHPERLPDEAASMIEDTANRVAFSAVSIWEIAIKWRLGRTGFQVRPDAIAQGARDAGFAELPIHADVAVRVADLPLHHADPFDRLLVAQAMAGPMRLLTADRVMSQYSELVTVVAAQPR